MWFLIRSNSKPISDMLKIIWFKHILQNMNCIIQGLSWKVDIFINTKYRSSSWSLQTPTIRTYLSICMRDNSYFLLMCYFLKSRSCKFRQVCQIATVNANSKSLVIKVIKSHGNSTEVEKPTPGTKYEKGHFILRIYLLKRWKVTNSEFMCIK